MSFDYHAVPGDYQYRALNTGYAMQRFWHRGKLLLIDQLVRPHMNEGSRILEIGCGSGNLLLQGTAPGSYPVALDLSIASLTFVRSRLEAASSGPGAPRGFACTQAVGDQLPFADGSFHCVLLSEVIEHLETPETTIREAARVLARGGRLLVTTPNYRSAWPMMEWAIDRLNIVPKMAGEQHITRFTPEALHTVLVESDLAIDYFGSIYGFSPFLAMASPDRGRRQLMRELARRSTRGMILLAVARPR